MRKITTEEKPLQHISWEVDWFLHGLIFADFAIFARDISKFPVREIESPQNMSKRLTVKLNQLKKTHLNSVQNFQNSCILNPFSRFCF